MTKNAYAHALNLLRASLSGEEMRPHLSGGALVALSGGKDSVLLLTLFAEYARENGIPFAALHLHHGIRGEEADRDAAFCKALCERLAVPFVLCRADVPALAEKRREGIEETARRERYAALAREADARGYGAVLTAHTATDNAETVLLHLLRGGGGRALCGIPAVRPLTDTCVLLRPLLSLTQDEVLAALDEGDLPYVLDSTNGDTAYHRNYLRHEILPRLSPLAPSPERAISRMTENLKEDMALLDEMAKERFLTLARDGGLDATAFCALPTALRYRVFRLLYDRDAPEAAKPERVHTEALFERLSRTGDFSVSFPDGVRAVREQDLLFLDDAEPFLHPHTPIKLGRNELADGSVLWILDKSSAPLPKNVYTLSIQRSLAPATIEGELYVRSRKEGDAYRYGGMTHKLKKMFSDQKIPKRMRTRLPVLCDGSGILWVPGFGVRDDGASSQNTLTAVYVAQKELEGEVFENGSL